MEGGLQGRGIGDGMGKYFGTDGIRGPVGTSPLTPEGIASLGRAASGWVRAGAPGKAMVVIGQDPRASSGWISAILAASFNAMGLDVCDLGTETTPGVAADTKGRGAALGIMVTASHNPYSDNGVKLFGSDGFKLPDTAQAAIEASMDAGGQRAPGAGETGTRHEQSGSGFYETALAARAGEGALDGLRILVDCANGAAAPRAPGWLARLGAQVEAIGVNPDGVNINAGCGATAPQALAARVVESGAYAGVAFDGDADRLIMVDERGRAVDGDQLIALIASHWHRTGRLKGGGVVATVMSNLGLERHLAGLGLTLERTKVGDRHVVQAMREKGFNLGGEQSGHLVMLDTTTTGDGLMAALEVLQIARADGRPFSAVSNVFEPVPQKLVNIRYDGADPLDAESVKAAIDSASARLGETGRVFVRKSGTEPLIRVMAEAVDAGALETALHEVVTAIEAAL